MKLFKQRNIEILTEVKVKSVVKNGVEMADGSIFKASLVVWSTGCHHPSFQLRFDNFLARRRSDPFSKERNKTS